MVIKEIKDKANHPRHATNKGVTPRDGWLK
jgi:hypothetical protein